MRQVIQTMLKQKPHLSLREQVLLRALNIKKHLLIVQLITQFIPVDVTMQLILVIEQKIQS